MKLLYYKQHNAYLPAVVSDRGVLPLGVLWDYLGEERSPRDPLTIDELEKLKEIALPNLDNSALFVQENDLVIGSCAPYPVVK